MTRLVIDASTLLSATVAAPDGPLDRLMTAVRSGTVEMIVCDQLLGEMSRGLQTRYFRDRLTNEERKGIMDALAHIGLKVADPMSPPRVVRDPKDDYLVALAAIGDAALIVTGDRDLLDHEGLYPPAVKARDACIRLGLVRSEQEGQEPPPPEASRGSARPSSHGMDRERRARHQRARLYGAMVESVYRRGYASTTIPDLVALAGVSRRAFYGQFANKEECFLATYDISVARSKKRILDAWMAERGWANRLQRSCEAFLCDAAKNAKSTRLVLIEGMGIGPRARERLLLASGAYERVVATAFSVAPDSIKLPPLVPRAIVGGGRYMIASRLRRGCESELPGLTNELLNWISTYRTPVARRLITRQLPNPPHAPVAPPRFLAGEDDRSRVLSAVVYLTLHKGLGNLSSSQIAQFADMSTVSFHKQFPDKEECFLAVLDGFANEIAETMSVASPGASGWAEAVCLSVRAAVDYVVTHPGLVRVAFIDIFEVGPRMVERLELILGRFVELLERDAPAPRLAPELTAEAITGAMWAVLSSYAAGNRLRYLPCLVDHLAFLVLAPYLGPKPAIEAIESAAR